MQLIFGISVTLGLIFVINFPTGNAECNVCQANGVACVNSTSFYPCYGSSFPNYEKAYHCKDGFDCTALNAICVQSSPDHPASCGDLSLCGLCSAHSYRLFACTSRSTFRLCYGAAKPRAELGYCPDGYVCDASSNNVCIRSADAKSVTCDISKPIDDGSVTETTTTEVIETSTDAPIPLTPQEVCDVEQKTGIYRIPGDTNCLEFVKCYMEKSVLTGSLVPCPRNSYFNGEMLRCVIAKPIYCT